MDDNVICVSWDNWLFCCMYSAGAKERGFNTYSTSYIYRLLKYKDINIMSFDFIWTQIEHDKN